MMTIDSAISVELKTDAAHEISVPDADLIHAIRDGDERACGRLVRDHGGRMFAVAMRFLHCEHDAADAVQDAFASAFNAIDTFEGDSKLSTWLHRIVVNTCLMKLRAKKSRREISIDDLLPTFDDYGKHSPDIRPWRSDIEDPLEVSETLAKVRSSIDLLPSAYRSIIVLRDIEQLDTHETARMLKCSVANAKVRLYRARQALRTLLDREFGEPPSPPSASPFIK